MNLKIQYKFSKDIFVLFCALNAFGYDDENNENGMHPLRKEIRKTLLRSDFPQKYPNMKKILYSRHQFWFLKDLFKNPPKKITIFKRFSKDTAIKKLWPKFKKIQLKESKKIFPLFKEQTIGLIKFINNSNLNIKKIILIFNPLDAYWRGYGLKINKTGYVIAGPGAAENLLRHELLHILAPNFKIPSKIIMAGRKNKALISMGYGSKKALNNEYIVRALNLLYESDALKKDISKKIKKEQINFPEIQKVINIIKIKLKKSS